MTKIPLSGTQNGKEFLSICSALQQLSYIQDKKINCRIFPNYFSKRWGKDWKYYQRNISITDHWRALTPSYAAGSISQLRVAEKLPSSFPVLFPSLRTHWLHKASANWPEKLISCIGNSKSNLLTGAWISSFSYSAEIEWLVLRQQLSPFLPLSSFLSVLNILFFNTFYIGVLTFPVTEAGRSSGALRVSAEGSKQGIPSQSAEKSRSFSQDSHSFPTWTVKTPRGEDRPSNSTAFKIPFHGNYLRNHSSLRFTKALVSKSKGISPEKASLQPHSSGILRAQWVCFWHITQQRHLIWIQEITMGERKVQLPQVTNGSRIGVLPGKRH